MPERNLNGYLQEKRLIAFRVYVEGNSYNAIARILKGNAQINFSLDTLSFSLYAPWRYCAVKWNPNTNMTFARRIRARRIVGKKAARFSVTKSSILLLPARSYEDPLTLGFHAPALEYHALEG